MVCADKDSGREDFDEYENKNGPVSRAQCPRRPVPYGVGSGRWLRWYCICH